MLFVILTFSKNSFNHDQEAPVTKLSNYSQSSIFKSIADIINIHFECNLSANGNYPWKCL